MAKVKTIGKQVVTSDLIKIVEDIHTLHGEIGAYIGLSMQRAIAIGEKITIAHKEVGHGGWLAWVDVNLPFNYRQSVKYVSVYDQREEIGGLKDTKSINDTLLRLSDDSSKESVDLEEERKLAEINAERLKEAEDAVEEYKRTRKELLEQIEELRGGAGVGSAIKKLQKQRQDLVEAIKGLKEIDTVIPIARTFFTKKLSAIPALSVSPKAVKLMKADIVALLELVDNWSIAMKEKFDV